MENTPTRLVWITFLAVMDEEGMCHFASVANLAHRARLTVEEAAAAVACLESEDEHSSDPEFEGRRIEHIPGGWIVLNADKYRRLVTREVARERTRERVAKFREKKRVGSVGNADVTVGNGHVAVGNGGVTPKKRHVTPSDAGADAQSDSETDTPPGSAVSDAGLNFADWFRTLLPAEARQSANWRQHWGQCYDEMLRLDNRTREQVAAVCKWAREDESFWKANFQTPLKLRQRKAAGHPQYFDVFAERMKTPSKNEGAAARNSRKEEKQYANIPGETPTFDPMAAMNTES